MGLLPPPDLPEHVAKQTEGQGDEKIGEVAPGRRGEGEPQARHQGDEKVDVAEGAHVGVKVRVWERMQARQTNRLLQRSAVAAPIALSFSKRTVCKLRLKCFEFIFRIA